MKKKIDKNWKYIKILVNIWLTHFKIIKCGQFYSKHKPQSSDFLKLFIDKMKILVEGLLFNGKLIKVLFKGIVCDAHTSCDNIRAIYQLFTDDISE